MAHEEKNRRAWKDSPLRAVVTEGIGFDYRLQQTGLSSVYNFVRELFCSLIRKAAAAS